MVTVGAPRSRPALYSRCYNTRELLHCRSRPPLDLISCTAPVCRERRNVSPPRRRLQQPGAPGTEEETPPCRPRAAAPQKGSTRKEPLHRVGSQQPRAEPPAPSRTMGSPSPAAMSPEPMCVRCTKFMGSPIMERSIRLLLFFCVGMKAVSPPAPRTPQHHPAPPKAPQLLTGCGFSTTQQPSLCQKSLIFAVPSSFPPGGAGAAPLQRPPCALTPWGRGGEAPEGGQGEGFVPEWHRSSMGRSGVGLRAVEGPRSPERRCGETEAQRLGRGGGGNRHPDSPNLTLSALSVDPRHAVGATRSPLPPVRDVGGCCHGMGARQ